MGAYPFLADSGSMTFESSKNLSRGRSDPTMEPEAAASAERPLQTTSSRAALRSTSAWIEPMIAPAIAATSGGAMIGTPPMRNNFRNDNSSAVAYDNTSVSSSQFIHQYPATITAAAALKTNPTTICNPIQFRFLNAGNRPFRIGAVRTPYRMAGRPHDVAASTTMTDVGLNSLGAARS